jgi:DNA-binding NarL/FixJ family response regulator
MHCSLLTKDLLLGSRVDSVAKQFGIALRIHSDPHTLLGGEGSDVTGLVLVDLALPGLDVEQLVPSLREQLPETAAIVAYGPHVDEFALSTARQAGCDHVLSRGEFNRRQAEILERFRANGRTGQS